MIFGVPDPASGHSVGLGGHGHGRKLVLSAACVWAVGADLFDQPRVVLAGDEGARRLAGLVDGLEDAAMHDLLLEGSDEPFDDAGGFGLVDEGVAGRHAPGPDLGLEILGHEATAVVVAQPHAAGCVVAKMAVLAHGHAIARHAPPDACRAR